VGDAVDAWGQSFVHHPQAEPRGDFHEGLRVSGCVGRKFSSLGVLVPEYGDGSETDEDLSQFLLALIRGGSRVLPLPDDNRPQDMTCLGTGHYVSSDFLPLSIASGVGGSREEHQ